MGIFKQNPFSKTSSSFGASGAAANPHLATISSGYRRFLSRNPFVAFGLPFIVTMVAGSFFLTPATAVRYEKFDRKTHTIDREQAIDMGFKNLGFNSPSGRGGSEGREQKDQKEKPAGGRFRNKDIREEYYRLAGQTDKLDKWEPVRVKRLPGEPDGTFD